MKHTGSMRLAVGVAVALSSMPLWAALSADKNFGLDVKITAQSEDDRDLGTRDGGDVNGLGLDLRPWVYGQRGAWSGYVMAQAVAATDIIETDTLQSDSIVAEGEEGIDDSREPEKNYLALREFWVDYSGLTAYPGEHLRLGRQRVRSDDSTWWDTNIEAVHWVFDTTLLRAQLGAAERFSDYRTDIDDLDPKDEDRLHLFGALSGQWTPGHWVGVKVEHAQDDGDLADVGETVDDLSKTTRGDLTWLGINADSDYFNPRNTRPLSYWAQAIWMSGDVDTATQANLGGQRVVTGKTSGHADAWATDLGLRWNVDDWRFGGGYARASGGTDDDGDSDQFVQTGLQSNRSNFTGTRSRVHRFGEAFRGELSNLQVATLFGAWQLRDEYDASLVYHRFWRVDDEAPTGDAGLSAALEDGEKDLGQEVDVVLTRYFKQGLLPAGLASTLSLEDEPSALVRLRGGLFFAGDAYGDDADSTMHRVFVDVVWRF
ncbi:alginate export family protein [Pseudomonas sp. UL073]|uniref:Alginate export family protein n=1 Tax=Zestomonas insulae TaxID=2809017 RepID=A0ABS2I9U7_9GAMM|nr:alginate export family protein [Pseudomonas insulae]MBM7059428.1 alginate export family protein [Pseudomonas insulae]